MTRVVTGLLCIVCLTLTACATRPGLGEELDRSVKAYNRMLRWHELENAVATYSDPEQREDYQKQAETLKKSGISITDFRILSTRYLPEKLSGDVVAEFDYFILPSNRVKTVSHRQEWVYRENLKSWKLKNGLPPFE
jgi:predicted small secreted protein